MIDLKSLLRGTPRESAPLTQPPRGDERIEELEAALVELAELIAGEEDE